jgi:hypothetical protein
MKHDTIAACLQGEANYLKRKLKKNKTKILGFFFGGGYFIGL